MKTVKELSEWDGELVVERIEDGVAHIEMIDGTDVVEMAVIDESALSDSHFHDCMSVMVDGDEIVPLVRESAERERDVKEKVERMGKRMEDIE